MKLNPYQEIGLTILVRNKLFNKSDYQKQAQNLLQCDDVDGEIDHLAQESLTSLYQISKSNLQHKAKVVAKEIVNGYR